MYSNFVISPTHPPQSIIDNISFYFWFQESFPESFFLHALALKGNSLRGVLRIAKASGLGGECASFPEAIHALSVGFEPKKVVFDSPCKTKVKISNGFEQKVSAMEYYDMNMIRINNIPN